MEALLLILGGIGLFFLLIIWGSFSTGFLVYKFWSWFIIPIFHLESLTFWQAVGLGAFISLFKTINIETKTINGIEIKSKINYPLIIIYPFIVLFIGYITHLIIR